MMHVLIIGNPENRRTALFLEAAAKRGDVVVQVLPYLDLLTHQQAPALPTGSIIRIDSPGENEAVRELLISRGNGYAGDLREGERGIIQHLAAWYKGYCDLLQEIKMRYPDDRFVYMNAIEDIRLMFDKRSCQQHLLQQQVHVPRSLYDITDYDSLLTAMHQHRMMRVFVKPSHASSASGVIAFRKNGVHVQAVTSIEAGWQEEQLKLYNSLKVRTYSKEEEIKPIINRILAEAAQVEEWIPKATLQERYFDIRVLVIAGRARHTVLRTSQKVITNLHLGNKRGDMQAFLQRFGQQQLQDIHTLAEQTAACFPRSLYMGVDILLSADKRRRYVLEVNAFGDLLPGLLDEGENCYEAELTAILQACSVH